MSNKCVLASAVALLLGGVGACGSTQTGVLTGTAWPCVGPSFIHTAHLWVFKDDKVVKHAEVPGGGTYRFVLPPGRYLVTNTGASRAPSNAVVVAGQTTDVNVLDRCK